MSVAEVPLAQRRYVERGASFLYTGGLVAVHAPARDRHSIWNALQQRNVYGTSGDRILLWFDLLNAPEGAAPMGSEVLGQQEAPRFRVAAAGAFEQLPGCPDHVERALAPERIASLCLGECYYPSDRRRAIERVEGIHAGPSQRRDVVHARPVHPLHREHRGGGELGEDPRRADVPQATVRVVKKAVF